MEQTTTSLHKTFYKGYLCRMISNKHRFNWKEQFLGRYGLWIRLKESVAAQLQTNLWSGSLFIRTTSEFTITKLHRTLCCSSVSVQTPNQFLRLRINAFMQPKI